MKKKHLLRCVMLVFVLIAALLVSGGCNGGSDGKQAGDVDSFAVVSVVTSADWTRTDNSADELITQKTNSAEPGSKSSDGWTFVGKKMAQMRAVSASGYYNAAGISSINMSYWTKNASGQLVSASAGVFVPHNVWGASQVPMYVICHPTEVERKNSPSKLVGKSGYNLMNGAEAQMHLAALIARLGYIVVIPDYLGLGDNTDVHPYCHEMLADSVIDAINAAAKLNVAYKIFPPSKWDGKKLLLMGFSEGGYAAMVTAKRIKAENALPLTAVATLDGPYSLSGTMRDVMLKEDPNFDFKSPYFMPYTLNGYDSVYGDKTPELKFRFAVLKETSNYNDYPGELLKLMDGNHSADEITKLMVSPFWPQKYHGPKTILSSEFLKLLEDPDSVVCKTMAANNGFVDWKPTFPFAMFHQANDDLVPIGNMNEAMAAFKKAGANESDVTATSFDIYTDGVGSSMHEKAFLVAFLKGFCSNDYYAYQRTW